MPADITYIVKPKVTLCKNYIIDPGFTNTTQFPLYGPALDGVRDSHVNDAYDGVVAWAWQVMRMLRIKRMAPPIFLLPLEPLIAMVRFQLGHRFN